MNKEDRWRRIFMGYAGVKSVESADLALMSKDSRDAVQECVALACHAEDALQSLFTQATVCGFDVKELAAGITRDVLNYLVDYCETAKVKTLAACTLQHQTGNPAQVYDVGEVLGTGSFGVVRKAYHRRERANHALKEVSKEKVQRHELLSEIDVMKYLDHPHILRLHNTFEDDQFIWMCFEVCTGGCFYDLLRSNGYYSEAYAHVFFRQIANVIAYLHVRSICHRDVKPENFLIAVEEKDVHRITLKLSDFGSAKRFDLCKMVTKICTPRYVAPELLVKTHDGYTEKVDVWSSGVMLFLMMSGEFPFHSSGDHLTLLRNIKKGVFQFEPAAAWANVSDKAKELVSNLIRTDASKRLSAHGALTHAWCQSRLKVCGQENGMKRNTAILDKGIVGRMHQFLTANRLKRLALHIIARQIDDSSIEALRNVFLKVDDDNSGTININDMEEAVKNIDVSEQQRHGMIEIIAHLDPMGEGNVEYTEFLAATMTTEQYLKPDVCRAAFVKLDQDGDGLLTRRDLAKVMSNRDGMRLAGLGDASLAELLDEFEQIFQEVDKDKDGAVNFDEFMALMGDDGHLPLSSANVKRKQRGCAAKVASMSVAESDLESADGDEPPNGVDDDDDDNEESTNRGVNYCAV